jgi:phospholipid/cholesterol/gamma-HCH transport system substrate-binding protein
MQQTISQKLQLGLFVITGLLIFVTTAYYLGNEKDLFNVTLQLSADFNNVNGLQSGNNVRYSGINAGTVREIRIINDSTIRVHMVIGKEIFKHIKKNAIATISSDGLVGSMIVNIIPGEENNQLPVSSGDIIRSYSRLSTDNILKTLNLTNENAALLTADLLRISEDIISGKGTISLLLNDSSLANDLKQSILNLQITSKGTTQFVYRLDSLLTTLDNQGNIVGVLKDSAMANQIKTIVSHIEKSGNDIHKAVDNLNKTILNIKEGQGAINYLSNDPGLVQQINSTMTNLDSVTNNLTTSARLLNENLNALKQNFLFRAYFKKLEKKNELKNE